MEIGSGDTTACILIFPNLIVDADIGSDSELGKVSCTSFSREEGFMETWPSQDRWQGVWRVVWSVS